MAVQSEKTVDVGNDRYARAVAAVGARDAFPITASDETVFRADALWVGTGGVVTVVTAGGSSVPFKVADGTLLPIEITQVRASGTADAADFVGLVY